MIGDADEIFMAALERLSVDELDALEAMTADAGQWPAIHRPAVPELASRIAQYRQLTTEEISRRIGANP